MDKISNFVFDKDRKWNDEHIMIIKQIVELVDKVQLIKIEDHKTVNAFRNINFNKPITVCFDIEFQHMLADYQSGYYLSRERSLGETSAPFIRELGMLIFIHPYDEQLKDREVWFLGTIFVNFPPLTVDVLETRLLVPDNLTVTDETLKKINLIFDKYFFIDDGSNYDLYEQFCSSSSDPKKIKYFIFGNMLDNERKKAFIDIYNLYYADELVIERINKIRDQEQNFLRLFSNIGKKCMFVVKGKVDIDAVQNSCKLYNVDKVPFYNVYDIELFNNFSHMISSSAKLEDTYKALVKTTAFKELNKKVFHYENQKAHNPVFDSLMTIVVAIIINIGLNNYFFDVDPVQIAGYIKKFFKK